MRVPFPENQPDFRDSIKASYVCLRKHDLDAIVLAGVCLQAVLAYSPRQCISDSTTYSNLKLDWQR